ncbi:hypothetical protein Mal4_48280 [Maioricimonas rarisocia]|uniref:Uncharacterized protein n=1 Tax=Maioricimonas rarisocia TaxID=2528026 RepID=A0A517ZDC8_9PLAN|nr:hypothetical protein [Maioricimonas rarisocia]QDU40471.1 hypothetical protein Mal4_48280 [Maioricimonas rarisocia]
MLTISQPAYDRLSELLADRPNDVAVRIVLREGRARIRPGRQREGDQAIEHEGRTVLLLDKRAARKLDHRTLGIRETEKGPRLKLRRPASDGAAQDS